MSGSNKRTPSTISMEEDGPQQKVTRQEEEAPAWAANMQATLSDVSRKMDDLNASMNLMQLTVASHEEQLIAITQKVGENESTIEGVDADVTRVKEESHDLKVQMNELQKQVNEIKDEQLRCTLVFYGIAQPHAERLWDWAQAEDVLAGWLSKNTSRREKQYYTDSIVRAHRGAHNPAKPGPRPIHAQFTWKCADAIMRDIGFKTIGGVRVSRCFSKATTARRNDALVYRRQFIGDNAGAKVKMNYPASLAVKKPGDERYSRLKAF